jgi:hypothetical protein
MRDGDVEHLLQLVAGMRCIIEETEERVLERHGTYE